MRQLDLFRAIPPDPLHGLVVRLPSSYRCGAVTATLDAGAGPHVAALRCAKCGAHRGWLAHEAHRFITAIINTFSRPTAPITIRRAVFKTVRRRGARRRIGL